MALQVWLPLNGKMENQGLSGVTMSGGPASYGNGPLGKCGVFNGGQDISIPWESTSEELTLSCWFYPNSPNSWADVFTFGEGQNRLEKTTTTEYRWYANSLPLFGSGTVIGDFPDKTWCHFALVADGEKCYAYINGKLQNTFNQLNPVSIVFGGTKKIFVASRTGGANKYAGSIVDVRVYDNALSPKEVHEIAQGLCCHYPLNDPTPTASINKYSGDVFSGKAVSYTDVFTMSELTDERGYKFTLNYTGTGKDYWANIQYPVVNFTAGKTYDYSCKVRANNGNFDLCLRAARMSNDWVTAMKSVMNRDGQWHEYHIRITLEAKSVRSGTEYDTKPLVEFYTQDLKEEGTVYKCDIDIKDIQISECNTDASISNGAWNDLTVYDTSGFGNNGNVTAATVPMLAGDSARYDKCYEFPYKHYITGVMPFGANAISAFTINVWINQIEGGGYSTWLNSNGYGGSGLWLAINTEGSGQWGYRGSLSPNYARNNKTIATNTWHMFTYVFNAGVVKWYLNGVKGTTTTYSSDTLTPGSAFTLGDSYTGNQWNTNFHGKLSDFRIYATALSDEDVAALYKTPISVTSSGAMIVKGEVIESI